MPVNPEQNCKYYTYSANLVMLDKTIMTITSSKASYAAAATRCGDIGQIALRNIREQFNVKKD